MSKKAIVWFRQDLRLKDNPALHHAAAEGYDILPLYILDETKGGASRWWLHHSLKSLGKEIPLVLKNGNPQDIVFELIKAEKIDAVFWNRCYEPDAIARDAEIKSALEAASVEVQSFKGCLLAEPWELQTGQGGFYKVYTPFWRALKAKIIPDTPLPAPDASYVNAKSDNLKDWELLPALNWADGFDEYWQPGEEGAIDKAVAFMESGLTEYKSRRDRMGLEGTSRLSPHLHFGEISPRQVWHAVQAFTVRNEMSDAEQNVEQFLKEVVWREFAYHLIYHVENFSTHAFRSEFDHFPWDDDPDALKAWQQGQTGIPIVDAAMRQLWQTGWMHNRARMIVGSFLTKHLLVPWQQGAAWFWDTLVDADLANNTAGWQWIAGCGADAAPYFRIFNPVLQSKKFDASGDYIRRFVPELSNLSDADIHAPWEASKERLEQAGILLGKDYPHPVIDLKFGRNRALAAYGEIKRK